MTQSRINIRLIFRLVHLPLKTRNVTSLQKNENHGILPFHYIIRLCYFQQNLHADVYSCPLAVSSERKRSLLRLWRSSRPPMSGKAEASFTEAVNDAGRRLGPAELERANLSDLPANWAVSSRVAAFVGGQPCWGGFGGDAAAFESSLLLVSNLYPHSWQ